MFKTISIALASVALMATPALAHDRDGRHSHRNNDEAGAIIVGALLGAMIGAAVSDDRDYDRYDDRYERRERYRDDYYVREDRSEYRYRRSPRPRPEYRGQRCYYYRNGNVDCF